MIKKISLVFLLVLGIGCEESKRLVPPAIDSVAPKNYRTILFFTASWCYPCKRMREVLNDSQVKSALNKAEYTIREIDIDNDKKTAQYYGIATNKIPLFVEVDDERRLQKFGVGYMSKEDFIKWINL